jgi:peptidoglycan/xylan/chitin deacetylase (PgdA/CDA1 family)
MRVIDRPTTRRTFSFELVAIGVAFVMCVSANPRTNSLGALALVTIVLGVAMTLGARVDAGRAAAIVGVVVALIALWLLAQRDDTGSAVILAALFGLAVALAARVSTRYSRLAIGALVVVAVGLRLLGAHRAVLFVTAIGVVVAAAPSLTTRLRSTRRGRARVLVIALVAVTAIFTCYIGAETPDATWFGGGITHGPTTGREVALTFDDGPDATSTPQIMAILDRYRVNGTFFEVGKAVDADPQITRQLYNDDQLIGNHSYHHDQWRWLDPRYPELDRDQRAIRRAIGVCPALYRPPHGDRTPFLARVVRDHHMHIVLWNVSAGDWATTDAQLVARRILDGAKPGAILLLHDGLDGNPTANRQVLVAALPLILDGLRARGLTPVRLDQLLDVPAYTSC